MSIAVAIDGLEIAARKGGVIIVQESSRLHRKHCSKVHRLQHKVACPGRRPPEYVRGSAVRIYRLSRRPACHAAYRQSTIRSRCGSRRRQMRRSCELGTPHFLAQNKVSGREAVDESLSLTIRPSANSSYWVVDVAYSKSNHPAGDELITELDPDYGILRKARGSVKGLEAADRLRIVVLGYLVRGPLGGMAWHHLQYVMGLARLGTKFTSLRDSRDFLGAAITRSGT